MDELILVLIPLSAAAAGVAGFVFGRRRQQAGPFDEGEFEGVQFSPQRGHRHEYTTMVADGVGWRCGVEVEPGVICGRPKVA